MKSFVSVLSRSLSSTALTAGLAVSLLALPACATRSGVSQAGADGEMADPFEGVNRAVYGVNEAADILFVGPASTIYHEGMPEPVQRVVRNFFQNLELPVVAINKLLQGDLEGMGTAIARFGVNSTVGLAGLADVATDVGLPYEETDFGVTLASWGVEPTAYVVLPLLGPSSVRDGIGRGVDYAMDPVRVGVNAADLETERMVVSGVKLMDRRAQADEVIQDARKNSLDSYATIRSLYAQHRAAEIKEQLGSEETSSVGAASGE